MHAPILEFFEGQLIPYQESPARADIILKALQMTGNHVFHLPKDYGMPPIQAIHDGGYLQWLQSAYASWTDAGGNPAGAVADTFAVRQMNRRPHHPKAALGYYAFDATTVITAGTWQAAYQSAQVAINAAIDVRSGARVAFALCRPPGHHAHADLCGGYCFLNNAAIAAQVLVGASAPSTCGVLDIDFHHGNGTQDIFYPRDDVLFISLHADTDRQYPYFSGAADEIGIGPGAGYNLNILLPASVSDYQYLLELDRACDRIVSYAPSWLVVSMGVDTFAGDPLGDFGLSTSGFAKIGQMLAQLNLPALFVMEGGYAVQQLGTNVSALLGGFEAATGTIAPPVYLSRSSS